MADTWVWGRFPRKSESARKVDMVALAAAIKAHPDCLQTELVAEFGVRPSTIHYARRRLGITRKKNSGATLKVTPCNDVNSCV